MNTGGNRVHNILGHRRTMMTKMKPWLPNSLKTLENSRTQWVLLSFRIPREPSTPRIAVWRKLKALGVAQIIDGLVALPLNNRNREQLEWLAGEVSEAGGDATIWLGRLASTAQEHELKLHMQQLVAADYQALIQDVEVVNAQAPGQQRRSLARLRRELRRIRQRDYFPPPERERAQQAVDELALTITEVRA